MDIIEKEKKKRTILYGLLVTVLVLIGVTYAYYRITKTQTNSNVIGTRTCLNTTLTEETSEIVLSDAFPISNEDGLKQSPFTFTLTNNCDSNVKVTIALVSEYRTSTNTAYLKDNYVKSNLSTKGTNDGSSVILSTLSLEEVDTNTEGYVLKTTGLKNKEAKSFDLRLWLDSETTNEQGLNKTWKGKIVVSVVAAEYVPTLSEAILANNEVKAPLTVPGKEVSAHTKDDVESATSSVLSTTYQAYYITYGTGYEANGIKFNLTGATVTSDTYANSYSSLVGKYLVSSNASDAGSATAGTMKTTTNLSSVYYVVSATSSSFTYKQITSNKNTTEALLASTEDDYGTSYYFRGAVKNNYVEFANKCWRIVRITGDGSVKLVLHNDNTSNAANPCSSANNSTNAAFARYSGTTYRSAFNSSYNDNAYVGFKYGIVPGCENHPEITDEYTCKKNNYTWKGSASYAEAHANTNNSTILNNLETWYNNNLTAYESVIADTVWCNDKTNVTDTSYNPLGYSNVTGLGYGTNGTYYGATQRLVSKSNSAGGTGPSLKCNGELNKITSKIGLITADELALAGYAFNISNPTTYLQENATYTYWWSLSPNFFYGGVAYVWSVGGSIGGFGSSFVNNADGVRPSISLKSTTNVTGEGTSENPYVVEK